MSSSSVLTILNSGISAVQTNFVALLPIVLPVAVALAVLFGIVYWIYGSAGRH